MIRAAYDVFARRRDRGLCCAIAQGMPISAFIDGNVWACAGTLRTPDPVPVGFLPEAAQEAVRLTGYYLFHAVADQVPLVAEVDATTRPPGEAFEARSCLADRSRERVPGLPVSSAPVKAEPSVRSVFREPRSP
mgnify:CR=1 FL=1